jgi:hypothetical protein
VAERRDALTSARLNAIGDESSDLDATESLLKARYKY